MKNIKTFLTALFILLAITTSAQTHKDSANVIRTADNLSSGSFKDVLKSFFQIAYDDLSSNDKEFNFSANLFAIKLKTDSTLNIDRNFIKQKFARNSNIDFGLKLDSNYSFNGIKAGYKYAIINNRDYAISKSFNAAILNNGEVKNFISASQKIAQEISRRYPEIPDSTVKNELIKEINDFFRNSTKKYGQLSAEAKELVRKFLYSDKLKIENFWNAKSDMDKIYEQIKNDYSKKLLWTVSNNFSTYSDGFLFSNIDLKTEATAGVIPLSGRSNIEFSAKAGYSFLDDTLRAGRDLKRQLLSSEFGLNFVSRNKRNKPVFEFEAAGSLNYIPSGRYVDETKTLFVFTGTLRIHITDDISVPVNIKYDPKHGNVFGFLNVKADFDLLNNIFGALH